MTVSQLFALITQITLVLITAQALVEFFRRRDQARLDIALMFGAFGIIVLAQWINSAYHDQVGWLGELVLLLLVAHPYLLLRLIQHLRPVPVAVQIFGLVGLVVSWALILFIPSPLPALPVILIVLYFAFLEIYSTAALIRGAIGARGVAHNRLLLAAAGSGLMVLFILLSGLAALFAAAQPILSFLSQVTSLAAILSYYLGFATPGAIRRSWQLAELHRFLSAGPRMWVDEKDEDTLLRLCQAAGRAVGGQAAAVVLWDPEVKGLRISVATGLVDGDWQQLAGHPFVHQVLQERKSYVLNLQGESPELSIPASTALLGAPILARSVEEGGESPKEQAWGVLLVFLHHTPLFVSDDLSILDLFCEQTGVSLGYSRLLSSQQRLIDQQRRYTKRLETVNEIDRAILAARSPKKIANAALSRLRELVPYQRASVVLFEHNRGEGYYIALDSDTNVGIQEGGSLPISDFPPLDLLRRGPYIVPDMQAAEGGVVQRLFEAGYRSLIAMPMIAEGEIIGELALSATEPHGFLPEHESIAAEIAAQLAITIQQARLREELQGYAEGLERRVAERTAQLKAANKELEAFAYSVSHDLRAPLRAVDGFSRILLVNFAEELSTEARRYLNLVRSNTQQMGRLIDDLLSFSRLSRQPLTRQRVDTVNLVRAVLREVRKDQEGRQVDVHLADLPPCQADPGLLKQVFINLIANTYKFTSKQENARIEIGCDSIDGEMVYFVRDNGVGFDMQYAGKLFGVFQRLHRQEDYEGTGVGLAIVHRIITRHGGRIWADAALNQGATFYFTIGAADQEIEAPDPE